MKIQTIKIVTISALTSTFLLGATPSITDIEKEIKVPKEVQKKEQELIDIGGVKKYAPAMKDDKSGKTILIKDFTISGNSHIASSELEQFFLEYKGKELSFNQLQNIAKSITKYYREKGYFVARAYIPAQNILKNDNVLEIAVIEGNYGKFKLTNNSLVKDKIVQGMLDDAKSRDNVIATSTLERAMLIINDTPGVVVTSADVKPGADVGTSDFDITTAASKKVDGYALVDNAGGRYTGKNRLMLGVNGNSLFGYGDKLSISGLHSSGNDLNNGRVSYSAPILPNGLKGEISYAQTEYSLAKDYASLDASGISKTLEAKVSYPYVRSRNENLYISTTVAKKDLEDISSGTTTKKDTKSLKLSLDYDKNYLMYGLNSNSQASFSITGGNLNDIANKDTGTNADGNYSKVNLELSNNLSITPKISLETRLSMQHALGNKNLDGSEDFSIGGSSGVKLYPSGELSGENGYLFGIEGKYKLPTYNSINSSIGLFYDAGRAHMVDSSSDSTFNPRVLQNAGIGYYASYKEFFGQVQAAFKVGNEDITSEPNREDKILFQAGMSF